MVIATASEESIPKACVTRSPGTVIAYSSWLAMTVAANISSAQPREGPRNNKPSNSGTATTLVSTRTVRLLLATSASVISTDDLSQEGAVEMAYLGRLGGSRRTGLLPLAPETGPG